MFSMLVFSISFSYFMKPSFKNYGSTKFNDDSFLTVTSAAAFFTASISRFLWGTAHDFVGFKACYATMLILQITAALLIEYVTWSKVLYFIVIMFIFVCEGGHFVIFPSLAVATYGPT